MRTRDEVFQSFGVSPYSAVGVHTDVQRMADRIRELEALLRQFRSDAQTTLDLYDTNGPTWTSRETGQEYYDASYVIAQAEERISAIDHAMTPEVDRG